jgi:hypothetical protein
MKFHFMQLLLSVVIATWLASFATGFYHNNFGPTFTRKKATTTASTLQSSQNIEATLEDRARLPDHRGDIECIRRYTELAIYNRGTEIGLQALSQLSSLCSWRIPYDFDSASDKHTYSIIERFHQLIPSEATAAFTKQVRRMEANGWLSTNPDSVDGLPSFHLNLVSNGSPMFPTETTKDPTDFQMGVQKLLHIVHPYIYNELLSEVQQLLNSTSIQISDVFLRRYGQEISGDLSRNGISAHYDVFSRVTAVVALDDIAVDGRNGLFTTHISESGSTSNHAALRRFFPLDTGDAVVHTWNVLHGVDIEEGLDRTSLIVWFTEDTSNEAKENGIQSVSPWIFRHPQLETDCVAQFVLASALSSIEDTAKSDAADCSEHRLYLKSASKGNTFAQTRIGSLVEEGVLTSNLEDEALLVVEKLRPFTSLPAPIRLLDSSDLKMKTAVVAMRFWFEGAVRGNPLAQKALADELMFQASQLGYDEDIYLLAATFFALAAQQGDEGASDCLARVIDYDLQHRQVKSETEFLASPIVKVARAAS